MRWVQVLRVLCFCMSYGNSCANPIIYNYASTDFRAGFRRAVYRLLVCVPKCSVKAKFHYTGPTGPDRTRADFVGDPHEPTEFLGDPGRSGPCGSGWVRSGPCSGI